MKSYNNNFNYECLYYNSNTNSIQTTLTKLPIIDKINYEMYSDKYDLELELGKIKQKICYPIIDIIDTLFDNNDNNLDYNLEMDKIIQQLYFNTSNIFDNPYYKLKTLIDKISKIINIKNNYSHDEYVICCIYILRYLFEVNCNTIKQLKSVFINKLTINTNTLNNHLLIENMISSVDNEINELNLQIINYTNVQNKLIQIDNIINNISDNIFTNLSSCIQFKHELLLINNGYLMTTYKLMFNVNLTLLNKSNIDEIELLINNNNLSIINELVDEILIGKNNNIIFNINTNDEIVEFMFNHIYNTSSVHCFRNEYASVIDNVNGSFVSKLLEKGEKVLPNINLHFKLFINNTKSNEAYKITYLDTSKITHKISFVNGHDQLKFTHAKYVFIQTTLIDDIHIVCKLLSNTIPNSNNYELYIYYTMDSIDEDTLLKTINNYNFIVLKSDEHMLKYKLLYLKIDDVWKSRFGTNNCF